MMPSLVAKFAPEGSESMPWEELLARLPAFESKLVGAMVYSTVDGFPVSIEIRQDIGAKDHPMHRSETWTWTRVPAP